MKDSADSVGADPPFDDLGIQLAPGRAAFNGGEFFRAHELWEDVWREAKGRERDLVQGLIQIAAGLHHVERGRMRPAARLMAKGLVKLERAPPAAQSHLGVKRLADEIAAFAVTIDADADADAAAGAGIPARIAAELRRLTF